MSLLQEELLAAVPGHAARGQRSQLLQLAVRHQVPGEDVRPVAALPMCSALVNEDDYYCYFKMQKLKTCTVVR